MPNIQCMLAGKAPSNLSDVRCPTTISYKLDGVRCLIVNGTAYSRNMKPIPSRLVQAMFGHDALNGLDGELIAGPPNARDVYRRTVSAVMSETSADDIGLYVFDHYGKVGLTHTQRLAAARKQITRPFQNCVEIVAHMRVTDEKQILEQEAEALRQGYEGLMIRDPDGAYKFGRSTTREGLLLKLKRFSDDEAVILRVEELQHNENEAERDALGHTQRSTKQAGRRNGGTLGALVVENITTGVQFNIGSGFDAKERARLWKARSVLPGMVVKYRFFPGGVKDKPRFPTFCGFRNQIDI